MEELVLVIESSNEKIINEENKKENNQFTLMINPRLVNKESAELYMQAIVNFYDNNPKFDYL